MRSTRTKEIPLHHDIHFPHPAGRRRSHDEHGHLHHDDHGRRHRSRRGGGELPAGDQHPHGGHPVHRGAREHHRRVRAGRGDVRSAVLLLLEQEPMHGYQLMQAIADRSNGAWRPSPGAIYPLLGQLEDEGLISVTTESGRRLASLTDAGHDAVTVGRGSWPDPFAAFDDRPAGPDMRALVAQVHDAARQVARSGTDAELEAAAKILTEARRAMYLLLAGEAGDNGDAGDADA